MRRAAPLAFVLLALAVQAPLVVEAQAQTAPPVAAPLPPVVTPTAPPGTAPGKAGTFRRQPLKERFEAANVTHDGYLTREQAAAANWPYLANHFDAIDTEHKGRVTLAEIRAYARAMRAQRQAAAPPASAAAGGVPPPKP